jgi:sec-independent protein translocase protein TatA
MAFWTPGPAEIVVIALVAIIIFGRKLPTMARTVGKTLIEYRKGMREYKEMRKDENEA